METILKRLKIPAKVIEVQTTGNITRYCLELLSGTTLDKIERKTTEIALASKAYGKPIIYPVLHKGIVVLEVITKPTSDVNFEEFSIEGYNNLEIPVVVGRTYGGIDVIIDLTRTPHMLVSGSTGSGKSVLLNSLICSVLNNPKQNIRLALIDPKEVEFNAYKNIKQLLYPIVNKAEESIEVLDDLIGEMNTRFNKMARKEVNNIQEYNRDNKPLDYIILVVDEFSDLILTAKREFQDRICLLAQKSRACGLHCVIATQRPSARVINGEIKVNFPSKICFKMASMVDSRVVLDRSDASKLFGRGDGLLITEGHDLTRFKGAFVEANTIKGLAALNEISWKTQLFRRFGL